jgi:hypothetical protein
MIPIKIYCGCGQKYAFDVHPLGGRMPGPVWCPICRKDGTEEANRIIAQALRAQTQVLTPPSVAEALASVQTEVSPVLLETLKTVVVQEIAQQRRELLAAQQAAAAGLNQLARRLEMVQMPLLQRLAAYEQRIAELEAELAWQSQENRELLKLKIDLLRQRLATERGIRPTDFN